MARRLDADIPIGVDDFSVHITPYCVDVPYVLAKARGRDPKKTFDRTGIKKAGVLRPNEDSVTMGTSTFKEVVDRNKLDPAKGEVDGWFFANESKVDGARPNGAYGLEPLESIYGRIPNFDVQENVFACVSSTDGLNNARNTIAMGQADVIVVTASDVALYAQGEGGEITQGAAAISMLVKANPRLLALDDIIGVDTSPRFDWGKPECDILPAYDGVLSDHIKLEREKLATLDYETQARASGLIGATQNFAAAFDMFSAHAPYPVSTNNGMAGGFRHAERTFPIHPELAEAMTKEPKNSPVFPEEDDFTNKEGYVAAFENWMKWQKSSMDHLRFEIMPTETFKKFHKEKVADAHLLNEQIGNSYTCPVYLGLVGHLLSRYERGQEAAGKRAFWVGYGSGAKSKAMSGTVQKNWKHPVRHWDFVKRLDERTELTIEQFDALQEYQKTKDKRNTPRPVVGDLDLEPRPGEVYWAGFGKFKQRVYKVAK